MTMAVQLCRRTCDSAGLQLLSLAYDTLLSSVSFLYSHPLHSAYLLYFSPYILHLLSFLSPLLLSTSFLFLFYLHSLLEGEVEVAAVVIFDQLSSSVVAAIGNVFEWEFEAMGELYMNSDLEQQDPSEANAENSARSEHFASDACGGEMVSCSSEERTVVDPVKGEVEDLAIGLNCDRSTREGSPELSSATSSTPSETWDSQSGTTDDQSNLKGCSFVPQTPDRTSETLLASSSLARRARRRGGSMQGFSSCDSLRTASMRVTGEFYQHSGQYREAVEGPIADAFHNSSSQKLELLRSQSHKNLEICTRKEKEWKRTLACKLYEERMTFKLREERTAAAVAAEGGEEMDLLWEAYEANADKCKDVKGRRKKKEAWCKEDEDEEDDDESLGRQPCCLQALKLSTGKMNLGVGRPSLAKMSKVFKGIGFFNRSGSRRSRKEY